MTKKTESPAWTKVLISGCLFATLPAAAQNYLSAPASVSGAASGAAAAASISGAGRASAALTALPIGAQPLSSFSVPGLLLSASPAAAPAAASAASAPAAARAAVVAAAPIAAAAAAAAAGAPAAASVPSLAASAVPFPDAAPAPSGSVKGAGGLSRPAAAAESGADLAAALRDGDKLFDARAEKRKDPDLVVLSDLHLNVGRDPKTGYFSRGENFFYDDEWSRFLSYLHKDGQARGTSTKLIINGDSMDFLKVMAVPEAGDKTASAISSISPEEKKFGLDTGVEESVWKLRQIMRGHPVFFQAMADFMSAGNEIVLTIGNHDVELYYDKMQSVLIEELSALTPDGAAAKKLAILPWFYYEPGLIYVEHGNMYDPMNSVPQMPHPFRTADGKLEVKLPPGSFFVRYFYNLIKEYDPFADAIKPHSKYMRYLLTHHILNPKIVAIMAHFVRMLFKVLMHGSAMTAGELNVASQKQQEMILSEAARYGLSPEQLKAIQAQWDVSTGKGSTFQTLLKYSAYSKEPPYRGAANAIREILGVKYIVFGHTHKLDLDREANGEYFNAGTWMALYVDDSDRLLRETGDVQFSFVRVLKNDGAEATVELLEWDDARGATDRIKLLAPLPR